MLESGYPSKQPAAVRKYYKKYYENNRDRLLAEHVAYYAKNANEMLRKAKERHINDPRKKLLNEARIRARKRRCECSIIIDDIVVPERCPVLGIKLVIGNSKLSDNSPTLDRINPQKGYVLGNIAVMSWRANRIKSDASVEEITKLAAFLVSEASRADEITNQLTAAQQVIRDDRQICH